MTPIPYVILSVLLYSHSFQAIQSFSFHKSSNSVLRHTSKQGPMTHGSSSPTPISFLSHDDRRIHASSTPYTNSPSRYNHRLSSSTNLSPSEQPEKINREEKFNPTTDATENDEWEYEEYEMLQEADFYNSEWKVGTLWDKNPNNIQTTWCRLVIKEDEYVAVWGDGSIGKWSFDVPSQFLGISKDSFGGWFGKKIWAGVVDDYYYVQGTVRGWSPISPASVLAQWQAKRLGVSEEEAGIAPWFVQDDGQETAEVAQSQDVVSDEQEP